MFNKTTGDNKTPQAKPSCRFRGTRDFTRINRGDIVRVERSPVVNGVVIATINPRVTKHRGHWAEGDKGGQEHGGEGG